VSLPSPKSILWFETLINDHPVTKWHGHKVARSHSHPVKQPDRGPEDREVQKVGWRFKEARVLELPEVSFGVARDCFHGMTQEMPIAKERYLI
jgi:hypothetical protein